MSIGNIVIGEVKVGEVSGREYCCWGNYDWKSFVESYQLYINAYFEMSSFTALICMRRVYPPTHFENVNPSLAETPESAGNLRYFAQICLQIFIFSLN